MLKPVVHGAVAVLALAVAVGVVFLTVPFAVQSVVDTVSGTVTHTSRFVAQQLNNTYCTIFPSACKQVTIGEFYASVTEFFKPFATNKHLSQAYMHLHDVHLLVAKHALGHEEKILALLEHIDQLKTESSYCINYQQLFTKEIKEQADAYLNSSTAEALDSLVQRAVRDLQPASKMAILFMETANHVRNTKSGVHNLSIELVRGKATDPCSIWSYFVQNVECEIFRAVQSSEAHLAKTLDIFNGLQDFFVQKTTNILASSDISSALGATNHKPYVKLLALMPLPPADSIV